MDQQNPNDPGGSGSNSGSNSGFNSGTSGNIGSGGTSTGAGYSSGGTGTGMSSGGGMTSGSGGSGADFGTGGSINSTGGATLGGTTTPTSNSEIGAGGDASARGTAGEVNYCTHCGQTLGSSGDSKGLEQFLGRLGISGDMFTNLKGSFSNVDIDEYLNTAREYLKGGTSKVTSYTKENPAKVAAGVAALALGAGLIYAAVNRGKNEDDEVLVVTETTTIITDQPIGGTTGTTGTRGTTGGGISGGGIG